jgi:hypothetical protein
MAYQDQSNSKNNYCNKCQIREADFICLSCDPNIYICSKCDGYLHSLPSKKAHTRKILENLNKVEKSNYYTNNKNEEVEEYYNKYNVYNEYNDYKEYNDYDNFNNNTLELKTSSNIEYYNTQPYTKTKVSSPNKQRHSTDYNHTNDIKVIFLFNI